jgi:hypothetical protein
VQKIFSRLISRERQLLCLGGVVCLGCSGGHKTVQMLLELRQQRVTRSCADGYCFFYILPGEVGLAGSLCCCR